MKALPLLLSLLLLSMSFVSAQQQEEVSVSEAEDYRDIGITEKGFEVKDPYALPVYEPRSTSLLPFHEQISSLLNSYLGSLLSTFDVKEAFALRILFEDIKPLLSFIGNLLSLPITCIALPFLSIARLIKAPLDILQFLITALLDPIFSIPKDEIAIIERFSMALKDLFYLPSLLLKPVEFFVYSPDSLATLASISFSESLHSFLSPFFTIGSEIRRVIDFIPFLNVVKGLFTAYLHPLFRSMISPLVSATKYILSPYKRALNVFLLPFSLSFRILGSSLSYLRSLLYFFVLPVAFLFRAPLTPALILFNFFKHSLQGFGQFLMFFSIIAPLLPALFALLLLLSFLPSIAVSSLVSLAILLISLASSAVLSIALSAILSLITLGLALLGGVALSVITAGGSAIAGVVLGALAGLVLGAVAGFLVGGIAGAMVGLAAGAVLGIIIGAIIGVVGGLIVGTIIGVIYGAVIAFGTTGIGLIAWIVMLIVLGIIAAVSTTFSVGMSVLAYIGVILLSIAALIAVFVIWIVFFGAIGLIVGPVVGLVVGAIVGLIAGAVISLFVGLVVAGIVGLVAGAFAGLLGGVLAALALGVIAGLLLGAAIFLLTIPLALVSALLSGLAGLLMGALPTAFIIVAGALTSLVLLPLITLPLSTILFFLFTGIFIAFISAPALLSILSPELFRVVFPPELIELAKRIALLPKDAVRVINGISHLPVDTMRAIAVLDDPAEIEEPEVITGEVIPYGAQQEMILEKNETATEELPEGGVPQDGTVTEEPAPQPTKEQEVYGPPESLKTPQEPTEPPEEPPAPTENISRALEGLEEIPKYESLEDVYEEGEKYFQNATTGLMGLSDELDVLKYGMDRIKELDQMEVDIRENLVYTDFLQGYGKTGRNFEEDLKNYSAQRLELDKKYQRYMADNSLNETESRDLWNDVWRLEEMNRDIKTHIEGGWNQTMINIKAAGIHNVTIFNPRNTETIKKLFGSDGPQFHPAEGPEEGIIDNLYANLKDDHDILSQARQEIENRQRELGVRQ